MKKLRLAWILWVGVLGCQEKRQADSPPIQDVAGQGIPENGLERKIKPVQADSDPLLAGLKLLPGQGGVRIEVVRGPLTKMTAPRMQDPTPFISGAILEIWDPKKGTVLKSGFTNKEGVWIVALFPGRHSLILKDCPGISNSRPLTVPLEMSAGEVGLVRIGCLASLKERQD